MGERREPVVDYATGVFVEPGVVEKAGCDRPDFRPIAKARRKPAGGDQSAIQSTQAGLAARDLQQSPKFGLVCSRRTPADFQRCPLAICNLQQGGEALQDMAVRRIDGQSGLHHRERNCGPPRAQVVASRLDERGRVSGIMRGDAPKGLARLVVTSERPLEVTELHKRVAVGRATSQGRLQCRSRFSDSSEVQMFVRQFA